MTTFEKFQDGKGIWELEKNDAAFVALKMKGGVNTYNDAVDAVNSALAKNADSGEFEISGYGYKSANVIEIAKVAKYLLTSAGYKVKTSTTGADKTGKMVSRGVNGSVKRRSEGSVKVRKVTYTNQA